jgi:hypothetical protein
MREQLLKGSRGSVTDGGIEPVRHVVLGERGEEKGRRSLLQLLHLLFAQGLFVFRPRCHLSR